MGPQIALSLALGEADVSLWARRESSLEAAKSRIDAAFDFLAREGLVRPDVKTDTISRLNYQTDVAEAVTGSGFVIEAVAEDLQVKQELLSSAEALVAETTVLSSTTSALGAGDIQSALNIPSRFCIAHYAQPAHLVELVEVVPGIKTAPHVTATVTDLLAHTGKIPVLCPDVPGFLWARIQHAVLREFATLIGKGLVTPEACDAILKQGYATRLPAMGAFEHADLAGLDLMNGAAAKAVWADLSTVSDPSDTPVGALFAEGKTGMSSGCGFYDWTKRDPEAFKAARDAEIVRRIKINAGASVDLKQ